MIGPLPKRPDGRTPQAQFDQWVYDSLLLLLRQQDVAGVKIQRTTRGIAIIPEPNSGGGGGAGKSDWRWA
jgi:hypothetical protein